MKRTEKSARNAMWGFIFQITSALSGFIIRTLLIHKIGMQVVSLNDLFTQIISLLSVSELGLGTAITYYLYKPMAENDEERLCRLMTMYKNAYRVVAVSVLGIGLAVIPFMGIIIKDITMPMWYIIVVYLLFVIQASSSYMFNYKAAILGVAQNKYLEMVIMTVTKVVIFGISAAVILIWKNFLVYLIISIVIGVIGNIAVALLANKRYPFLKKSMPLDKTERKGILKNVKYMFIMRLSGRITTSTDNVLISSMVSTIQVGFYGNYSMIISTVTNVINQMSAGTVGSIGNLMVTESDEKCAQSLRRLILMFFFIASSTSAALYCCLSPFVALCWGKQYIMGNGIIFVCVLNNFLTVLRMPLWNMLDTSGMFRKIKNVSIAGTVINLIVSILLTLKVGMVGIFIGTTCTIVIQIVLNIRLIYGVRLKQKYGREYLRWSIMTALGLGGMFLSKWVTGFIKTGNSIIDFLLIGIVAVIIGLVVAVVPFCRSDEFSYCVWLAGSAVKGLKKKLLRK